MPAALLGRKLGMTRYFTEDGKNIPVTVIEAGPCVVTQVKTRERDQYAAIQIGYGDVKPRRSTMPLIGHDARAGSPPRRFHRELRLDTDDEALAFELGQTIGVDVLEGEKFVDITARSKGKGFAGAMKRHNFAGLEASHGVKRYHRRGGSIGGHATNLGTGPKPKKGKRMPGRLGDDRVTVRNMDVVAVDPDRNLLLVKGAVPGPNQTMLFIRTAKRLGRRKARIARSGS